MLSSTSSDTLGSRNLPTLFVSTADGYSGYYAVWEAVRKNLFHVEAAVTKTPSIQVLEHIPREIEHQRNELIQRSGKSTQIMTPSVHCHLIDPFNPSTVSIASSHSDVALIIPPANQDKVEITKNMIQGVKDAGISSIVLLSSIGSDIASFPSFQHFAEIEQFVENSGLNFCIIRSSFYFQNLLLFANNLTNDSPFLSLPIENDKFAPVDIQDVLGCAVECCRDIVHHSGQIYTLTGTQVLDGEDLASCWTMIAGKDCTFKPISPQEFSELLDGKSGLDPSEALWIKEYFELVRESKCEKTTQDVVTLLKHDPTDVQGFFKKHSTDLRDPERIDLKSFGQ